MRCANCSDRAQLEEQWWVIASVLESDDGGLHLNLTAHGARTEPIVWQVRRLHTSTPPARFTPCRVTTNNCVRFVTDSVKVWLKRKHMPTPSRWKLCDAATYGWVPPHTATYTQLTLELTWGGADCSITVAALWAFFGNERSDTISIYRPVTQFIQQPKSNNRGGEGA